MQDRSRLTTSLQESCSIFSNNNARIGKQRQVEFTLLLLDSIPIGVCKNVLSCSKILYFIIFGKVEYRKITVRFT